MAKMVSINHSVHVDPHQRIVKAADVETWLDFSELQTHAQKLIAQAELDAEQMRQQAIDQGFTQGVEAAEQHITQKLLALTAEKANFVRELERQLPSLVLSLVRRILVDYDDAEKLASLTQEVLLKVKSVQRVVIRIHSSHVDLFSQAIVKRLEQSALLDCIEIEADNEIPLHQCHVVFEDGLYILDWKLVLQQIETQMNAETAAVI